MNNYKIKLNFTRPIIGSQPSDEEIRRKYITAKMITGRTGISAEIAMARVDDEIENFKKSKEFIENMERPLTVFFRDEDGNVSLSDVQLRGFIKDAFAFVSQEHKILKKKQKKGDDKVEGYAKDYCRRWIGERISFKEQYFILNGEIDIFERPIRCKTQLGERISIASSERIKKPSMVEFELLTSDDVTEKILRFIFDRGLFKGLGQWANAQWGCFTYELEEVV